MMQMKLLAYEISFKKGKIPVISKEMAGEVEGELLFDPRDIEDKSERTKEGLKLEAAYKILNDYKGLETSEKYLEKFVDRFLSNLDDFTQAVTITPEEIERWLDVELNAKEEHITGQKWSQ